MAKKLGKIVGILLIVLVLVYFAFQAYMIKYPSYKTEAAVRTEVSNSVAAKGIAVRNETVITTEANGIKNYLVNDGEKVAKGASVAEVYLSNDSATKRLRLNALEEELGILKNLSELGQTSGTNVTSLTTRIYGSLSDYSASLAEEDFSAVNETRLETIRLISSFNIAAGNGVSLEARIAELEAEIGTLNSADVEPGGYISTPIEGYFVSAVDGFEGIVDKAGAENMSVTALRELIATPKVKDNDICKMISDYRWYYVFETDKRNATLFADNPSMKISFNYASVNSLPVKLVSCTEDAETDSLKVIVEGTYLNSEIARLRLEEATIDFTTYSGIKIDRSALRIQDGKVGVYVKFGSKVIFKQVEPIYETEDFVLVPANSSDDTFVELYDEIIVEGKDIYVGKELGNR